MCSVKHVCRVLSSMTKHRLTFVHAMSAIFPWAIVLSAIHTVWGLCCYPAWVFSVVFIPWLFQFLKNSQNCNSHNQNPYTHPEVEITTHNINNTGYHPNQNINEYETSLGQIWLNDDTVESQITLQIAITYKYNHNSRGQFKPQFATFGVRP